MIYRMSLFILAMLLVLTPRTFAHSTLKESIPKAGETVQREVKEITLVFSTKVEMGSKVELKNDQGEVIIPKVTIQKETMKATFDTSLPNGNYTVFWRIIGADGHLIKGDYSIKVDQAVAQPVPESSQNSEPEQSDKKQEEDISAVEPVQSTGNDTQPINDNNFPSNATTFLVAILALLGIGGFIWLMKRKG